MTKKEEGEEEEEVLPAGEVVCTRARSARQARARERSAGASRPRGCVQAGRNREMHAKIQKNCTSILCESPST